MSQLKLFYHLDSREHVASPKQVESERKMSNTQGQRNRRGVGLVGFLAIMKRHAKMVNLGQTIKGKVHLHLMQQRARKHLLQHQRAKKQFHQHQRARKQSQQLLHQFRGGNFLQIHLHVMLLLTLNHLHLFQVVVAFSQTTMESATPFSHYHLLVASHPS